MTKQAKNDSRSRQCYGSPRGTGMLLVEQDGKVTDIFLSNSSQNITRPSGRAERICLSDLD